SPKWPRASAKAYAISKRPSRATSRKLKRADFPAGRPPPPAYFQEGDNMDNLRERLERGVAILNRLDQRRLETRSPLWGYNTEYLLIGRDLRQLKPDLLLSDRP